MSISGWVGVDLDGTLAEYHGWNGGAIGEPVPAMLARVKGWLAEGVEVRVFTARVQDFYPSTMYENEVDFAVGVAKKQDVTAALEIQEWTRKHFGQRLTVTNRKDFAMIELYDDRCVQIEANTGRRVDGKP